MSPIRWASGGPSPSSPRFLPQVHRVRPTCTSDIRFLGVLVAVWVHYVQQPGPGDRWASVPCDGDDCRHCPAPVYWKGYAPAQAWLVRMRKAPNGDHIARVGAWIPVVVELTEGLRWLDGEDLRGRICTLTRPGKRSNSPLQLTWVERVIDGELPDSFDVRPSLYRLWNRRGESDQGGADGILKFRRAAEGGGA